MLTLIRFCYGMSLVIVRMCDGFPVKKTPAISVHVLGYCVLFTKSYL